jgi:hypothetical protein
VRRAVAVALLGLLWSASSFATEVLPIFEGSALGAEIRELRPPESLRKDLVSGLTNRVLIRISLLSGTEVLAQRAVELTVRYDLWDEVFALHTIVDGERRSATTVKSAGEALAFLRNVRLASLFPRSATTRTSALVLKAEVLLNPIDRERMEAIRKWVEENTAPTTRGLTGTSPAGNTSPSANAIFNRIFEQYAVGGEFAAVWKEALTSQPFVWDAGRETK